MSRSPEYTHGMRAGIKWAITYLHERAGYMSDPHARAVLNEAAFNMGRDAKTTDGAAIVPKQRMQTEKP